MSSSETGGSLRAGSVGFWELLGQSIALIAPLGAVAATLTGAAVFTKGSLPLAYLIALLGVAAWIMVPYEFSKKIASAGGFYSFTAQGIGPRFGLFTGYLYLFFLFNVVTNSILFVGGVFLPGVLSSFFGVSLPSFTWVVIDLAFLGSFGALAYAGIRPSLRYSLAASVAELVLLVGISLGILLTTRSLPLVPFTPGPAGGWGFVFVGMVLAIFSMSGSSGAVYIGEETRQPRRNVRRAVLLSFLITGAVFVLTSYALTVGWGVSRMGSFATSGVPGLILTDRFFGLALTTVLLAFILNGLFAGSLAPLNSAARLFFAMGRDRAAPAFAARIQPRFRTPSSSILFLTVLAGAVSLAAGFFFGPFIGYIFLVLASAVGLFLGHLLGCVALPVFYRRLRELNPVKHVLAPGIAFVILLAGIYFSFYPPVFPVNLAITTGGLFAAAVVVGIVWFGRRHPEALRSLAHVVAAE